jgi:hypothetical protein
MINEHTRARLRAHAHGVIAADMAADGHANWEGFHRRKQKQAVDQSREIERQDFLDGGFEIAG